MLYVGKGVFRGRFPRLRSEHVLSGCQRLEREAYKAGSSLASEMECLMLKTIDAF